MLSPQWAQTGEPARGAVVLTLAHGSRILNMGASDSIFLLTLRQAFFDPIASEQVDEDFLVLWCHWSIYGATHGLPGRSTAQLPAQHSHRVHAPVVITHGDPLVILLHLHTTFAAVVTSH